MIIDEIRKQIKKAMKLKDSSKISLLRLIVGTAQQDNDESDKSVEKIIRKFIKNNNQTIEALKSDDRDFKILEAENNILISFLPKSLSVNDIIKFIKDNNIDISGSNPGKVIGRVLKEFTKENISVQGSDVKLALISLSYKKN